MLIPVIDADQMRCPMERFGTPDGNCIGAKCAAWRFADVRKVMGYCGIGGTPLALDKD